MSSGPTARQRRVVLRGDPPPGKSMMETDRDLEWALLTRARRRRADAGPAPYDADRRVSSARSASSSSTSTVRRCRRVLTALPAGRGRRGRLRPPRRRPRRHHGRACTPSTPSVVERRARPTRPTGTTYLGGLIDRFRQADAAHIEAVPFLRYVAAWLDAHRPPPLPLRLVHSDFQTSNIVVDPAGAHHLIDWELAHVGDPREDLGYYNVYSSALGPNLFAADPEAFLARYRQRTGFGEDAVNLETMAYFSSLAAITVYAQVLGGAAAMARGANGGLMTTYTINALTVGHGNFMSACTAPDLASA